MIRKLRVVEVLCEDEEHCSFDCPNLAECAYCMGESVLHKEHGWLRTESCKREAVHGDSTADVFIRYIGVSATAMQQAERIEQLEHELAEERARR